jgi:glucokinase
MANMNAAYVVGVDLGGTKIYSAVIDKKGAILGGARKKTKGELGFDVVVTRIVKCINEALETVKIDLSQIGAIGIGSPGPLDLKAGKIIETPNLKWKNAPLRDEVEKALKKPVFIDNDGNMGMLGEHSYGAAKGAEHAIGLFIGTGIGGGVIVDNRLLHGYNENAAELGHIILDPEGPLCGCGNKGCLEAFASRLAIEREIRIAWAQGIRSKVFDQLKEENIQIRSKVLAEAFHENDPAVVAAVKKSAKYLGYGVASLLNIFNPEVVVLGGGVVEAIGEDYVKLVRQTAEKNVFPIAIRNVRIVSALLKDDSAVLGAASLAWTMSTEG